MVFSPYPLLMRGLALPDGPGGRHGRRHGAQGTAKHRQPDATRFGGAAVHPHRVLEAPVRPSRCRKHSSGHRGVEFSQIHIPDSPHRLLTQGRGSDAEMLPLLKPREDGWLWSQSLRFLWDSPVTQQAEIPVAYFHSIVADADLSESLIPHGPHHSSQKPSHTSIHTLSEHRRSRRQQMEECVQCRDQR